MPINFGGQVDIYKAVSVSAAVPATRSLTTWCDYTQPGTKCSPTLSLLVFIHLYTIKQFHHNYDTIYDPPRTFVKLCNVMIMMTTCMFFCQID